MPKSENVSAVIIFGALISQMRCKVRKKYWICQQDGIKIYAVVNKTCLKERVFDTRS